MRHDITATAQRIIEILKLLPGVNGCRLYGSLANGKYDRLSDIDIAVETAGIDNGLFALKLPFMINRRIPVIYADYAPSLAPEQYIVSIAIDEEDPFMMIDLNCIGYPHCSSVTREQLSARNDRYSHMLKLWTANMKHHVRGADCRGDILRMVRRINISDAENHSDAALLEKTLCWLEENAPAELAGLTASCRRHFDALT